MAARQRAALDLLGALAPQRQHIEAAAHGAMRAPQDAKRHRKARTGGEYVARFRAIAESAPGTDAAAKAWLKAVEIALEFKQIDEARNGVNALVSDHIRSAELAGFANAVRAASEQPEVQTALRTVMERTGAANGDLIFFGADRAKVVNDALGALRLKIGHEKGHVDGRAWAPLWVVDFPMFEYNEDENRWDALHHPFTAPKDGHEDWLATDPGRCLSKAYDMVLNGWELGGGSVRIHRADVQSKVFRALKIDAEEAQLKFGFLLDALQYGAPPHGGLAFGLDRIVTMMAGAESIRDVIAFPKTQRAQCLLTQAPSEVDEKQLRELHIRLRATEPAVKS